MTIEQKREILGRIQEVEQQLGELRKTRFEILSSGFQSASMASGSGSKSYSRQDAQKLTDTIKVLSVELKQLKAMLRTGSSGAFAPQTVTVVYS